MSTCGHYETVWPGGASSVHDFLPVARPASLDGLTIGFVWDYVFRGDEIFSILEGSLAQAFPQATFVGFEKFGNVFGLDEHAVRAQLPGKLADLGVDVVICGVGCCGGCTPAVVRASAAIERAGIPTVSLVCEGFHRQARAVAPGLGCAWLPVVEMPAYVDSLSVEELRELTLSFTHHAVIEQLTATPDLAAVRAGTFASDEIVARGDFAEINRIYRENGWSDGLPVVPPTATAIAEFLRFTADAPDRIIGSVQPSGSFVTVWNVAVNGVMAGCEPAFMPVLIAVAEALSDPGYGVEHSGDTTGGDALVIISGPDTARLGFNAANGAQREGAVANTTIGRFVRLFLRNIAGMRPGAGDKSTFGHSARVVLAENRAEVDRLGWTTFGERMGFDREDTVVTVGRFTGDTVVGSIYGRDPEVIAEYLADGLVRQQGWELVYTVGQAPGTNRPLLALSPMVAKTLARSGCTTERLRDLLFRHARIPAWKFEDYLGRFTNLVSGRRTLGQMAEAGIAADIFAEGEDGNRLVPIVERAEDILIVVSGDPYRSNAMAFGSNGLHGFPTSRKVRWIA